MPGPQVTLEFAGDSRQLETAFDRVGAAARQTETEVTSSSQATARTTSQAFDRVGDSADNLDTRAMGFRDTLTGVQDSMAGTAAIARGDLFTGLLALGMGVGDLASGFANLIIPALKNFSAVSKVASVAQAAFNAVMNANPIFLVITAVAALAAGLTIAYQKSETFRDIVDGAWDVISDAVSVAWERVIKPAVEAVGEAFQWLWERTEFIRDGIGQAFGWIAEKIGLDSEGSEESVEDMGASMDDTKESTDELAESVETLAERVNELVQPTLDHREALRNVREAVREANEAIAENGAVLTEGTEAADANQEALDNVAEATRREIEAADEAGESAERLAERMEGGREQFIRVAEQMGATRGEAEALATELGLIPGVYDASVDVETATALASIGDIRGALRAIPDNISVNVRAAMVGRTPLVGANARGGPVDRGEFSVVGEEGPELVQFGAAGRVFPADATAQMMRGGTGSAFGSPGGGGSRVVLEIRSGGSRIDDALTELLRGAIRKRGGSVQAVLGQA